MTRNANRMQEAVDRLSSRFGGYTAVPSITYTRGNDSVIILDATVGRTPFQIVDGDVMIAYESRDYIVPAASLSFDGGTTLVRPAGGDLISDGGRTYEVAVPKPLNVFESIGPGGSVLKIHTKAIG